MVDDLKEKRGYGRSHSVENQLFKKLWTYLKTEHRMTE